MSKKTQYQGRYFANILFRDPAVGEGSKVADLDNVERAFTDLSSKFERTRDVVTSFATTEDSLKQEAEVLAGRWDD